MTDNALDFAKFELDKTVRLAEIWMKLARLEQEIVFKQVEILRNQIQACCDAVRLRILRKAFARYLTEQKRLLKVRRGLENFHQLCAAKARDIRNLARGEFLPPDLVPFVWMGFVFFMNQNSTSALIVAGLKLDAGHRRGKNFSWNRDDSRACEGVPADVTNAAALIHWLRTKNLMPKIGSSPWLLLMEVVNILNRVSDNAMTGVIDRFVVAEDKLEKLRREGWEQAGGE